MNKKPRISHLTNRVQPTLNGHLGDKPASAPPPPSAAATPTLPQLPPARLPVSNPQNINSNSNSPSTPEGRGTQDLPMDTFSQNSGTYEDQQEKYTSRTNLENSVPTPIKLGKLDPTDDKNSTLHKKAKKAKKHKDKDRKKLDAEPTVENKPAHLKEEIIKAEKSPSLDEKKGAVILYSICELQNVWGVFFFSYQKNEVQCRGRAIVRTCLCLYRNIVYSKV